MLAAGAYLLSGCSKPLSENVGGSITTQIPLQNEAGGYDLQQVQLTQLESLRSMRGEFGEFFLSPRVQTGGLEGSPFQGQFAKMGDLWIARDIMSLTASTIYYHLQELWHLDVAVGAADLKPKRQQVALSAIINDKHGQLQDNALFEVSSRALLFVPYTSTNLPISVNSGILAHEHFHSIFYPLVLEPLIQGDFVSEAHSQLYRLFGHPSTMEVATMGVDSKVEASSSSSSATEDPQKRKQLIYHLLWLKAINEGLADVWGWAYTWDPDFIALSLPSQKTHRTLSVQGEISSFVSASSMKSKAEYISRQDLANIPDYITDEGYVVGTEWARFFKQYLDKSLQNPETKSPETTHQNRSAIRQKVLSGIIVSLAKMRTDLLALKAPVDATSSSSSSSASGPAPANYYDPVNFLISFSQSQKGQTKATCETLARYLHSLPRTTKRAPKQTHTSPSTDPRNETAIHQGENLRSYSCKEDAELGFQPSDDATENSVQGTL